MVVVVERAQALVAVDAEPESPCHLLNGQRAKSDNCVFIHKIRFFCKMCAGSTLLQVLLSLGVKPRLRRVSDKLAVHPLAQLPVRALLRLA